MSTRLAGQARDLASRKRAQTDVDWQGRNGASRRARRQVRVSDPFLTHKVHSNPPRATATPNSGPRPLRVVLDSRDSIDPEEATLEASWDFDAGEEWTPLSELPQTVHIFPSEDVTALAEAMSSSPKTSA